MVHLSNVLVVVSDVADFTVFNSGVVIWPYCADLQSSGHNQTFLLNP
jgi:hypothetical protein